MIIRPLTFDDYQQLLELMKKNPTLMKVDDEEYQDTLTQRAGFYLKDPHFFNIGCFDDGKLVSTINFYESDQAPSWTIIQCTRDLPGAFCSFPEERTMLQMMFQEAESRGLTRFYICFNAKMPMMMNRSRVGARILSKWIPEITKYEIADDAVIPAGTMPKYSYQKVILGKPWPIDLIIRCGFLKNEYRKTKN